MEGSDNSDRKPGSVGYPLPGLSIKLVKIGTEEEIMPADVVDLRNESQRGEILVKGPTVFAWYTQHTRKDMAANFTEDGYYKTGDVAVADKDGCLWIVDRTKELIKSSGFQVSHCIPCCC
jgi:long-subunit acyl-CoA synthetase (AMP-forming)